MKKPEPTERELLALGDRIAGHNKVRASSRLRIELRRSLMTAPAPAPRRNPFVFVMPALRPVLAASLALAILVGASGAAAASSLPGDPAFALKRGVEGVELALASDDVARLDVLLTQSDRRLADLHRATATSPAHVPAAIEEYAAAVAAVETALAAAQAAPATSQRDAALARVAAESETHLAALEALAARLPDAAQPGIQRAIEAQQAVHGRSNEAPGQVDETAPSPGAPAESGRPGRTPPGRPSAAPSPRR